MGHSRRFLRVHATYYPPKLTVKADVADDGPHSMTGSVHGTGFQEAVIIAILYTAAPIISFG
jgi:hypothetical protein